MVEDLAAETARRLIAAYHSDGREPSLRFPPLRDGRRRVSEQEARVVMCQVLEGERGYSIEYPTTMRHSFSGQALLSARIDLAVWAAHGMDLAVEFKAGQPPQEAIDKDMVKLVGEGVRGLWLHTLEGSNSATLPSLFGKLKVGLENGRRTWLAKGLAANSLDVAAILDHELTVAVVVLKGRDQGLWTQRVQIDQGISDQRADWEYLHM